MPTSLVRATPTALAMRAVGQSQLFGWLLRGGFFLAVVGGAFWVVRKIIFEVRRNHLLSQVGTNTQDGLAIGFAGRIYASLIPSGQPWLNDTVGDGTTLDDLFAVATDMYRARVSYQMVAGKYQGLYARDLLADLNRDLNASELQQFNAALSTGRSGLNGLDDVPFVVIDSRIRTTAPTTVYDEQLLPVQQVPAGGNLGEHIGTMFAANGTYHEFMYGGLLRRVPVGATQLIKI